MSGVCSCIAEDELQSPWKGADCHIAITGASRGFGRALCIELIKLLTKDPGPARSVTMLLMARDVDALEKTKDMIMMSKSTNSNSELNILISRPPVDMRKATEHAFSMALLPLFDSAGPIDQPDQHKQWNLLIHNAATTGALELRADELTSSEYLDEYYHINLIAPILLTSVFLRHFAPLKFSHPPITILNVSSLGAIEPLPHMSDYCVAKAAREMYMRMIAVDRPTVAVFNYSPGPLDTDMYSDVIDRIGDPACKAVVEERKLNGRLIQPEESARVCVSWLRRHRTEESLGGRPKALVCPIHQADYLDLWRGTHLDYYDAVAVERTFYPKIIS